MDRADKGEGGGGQKVRYLTHNLKQQPAVDAAQRGAEE